jgi:hypothetical protein
MKAMTAVELKAIDEDDKFTLSLIGGERKG